jgi:hypothetical protein
VKWLRTLGAVLAVALLGWLIWEALWAIEAAFR